MKPPVISVVMSGHNRAELFRRTLQCYAQQVFKDFEIIMLDDDSDDDLTLVCRSVARSLGITLRHFWFCQLGGHKPRSSASLFNYGLRASPAEFIIQSSPEIMPGPKMLEEFLFAVSRNGSWASTDFFNAKPYLLTADQQALIDTVDWRLFGAPAAVRMMPGFYSSPSAEVHGLDVYAPANMDRCQELGTDMTSGMTRAGWKKMGGYPECDHWGPSDPVFMGERVRLGIRTITLQEPDSFCVHQNHDHLSGSLVRGRMDYIISTPWNNLRW